MLNWQLKTEADERPSVGQRRKAGARYEVEGVAGKGTFENPEKSSEFSIRVFLNLRLIRVSLLKINVK